MQQENIFRLIVLLGFAVVAPVGLYHRLKAHYVVRERIDRRGEGLFMLATLRPMAIVGMLGVVAYLVDPSWMNWSAINLPLWARWAGVGIGTLAAGLFIVVFRALGRNITDTVVTRANATLVTDGPYRWVRHPLYSATALTVVAAGLVTANWFVALIGAIIVALLVIRTRIEEQKLTERFGDEYTGYMQRTGRFVPRLR